MMNWLRAHGAWCLWPAGLTTGSSSSTPSSPRAAASPSNVTVTIAVPALTGEKLTGPCPTSRCAPRPNNRRGRVLGKVAGTATSRKRADDRLALLVLYDVDGNRAARHRRLVPTPVRLCGGNEGRRGRRPREPGRGSARIPARHTRPLTSISDRTPAPGSLPAAAPASRRHASVCRVCCRPISWRSVILLIREKMIPIPLFHLPHRDDGEETGRQQHEDEREAGERRGGGSTI